MNRHQLEWNRRGFFVIRQLLTVRNQILLKQVCDRIFNQWLSESPNPTEAANFTNLAYLTEPRYFSHHPQELVWLLELMASETVFGPVQSVCDRELIFHNTQYFFEPATHTRDGDWHRDQQFDATDEAEEQRWMATTVGIHIHIALEPDDHLEIVPGTHARWDTPEERNIRKGLNGIARNALTMPGAVRVDLQPGDACVFNAWSIHRGRYVAGKPRRTFDVIYGTKPDSYVTPPTCFLDPKHLDGLSQTAHQFYSRFIATYRDLWNDNAHEPFL